MNLMKRIEVARQRKQLRFAVEKWNGERAVIEAIAKAKDGGLLVHVAIERAS